MRDRMNSKQLTRSDFSFVFSTKQKQSVKKTSARQDRAATPRKNHHQVSLLAAVAAAVFPINDPSAGFPGGAISPFILHCNVTCCWKICRLAPLHPFVLVHHSVKYAHTNLCPLNMHQLNWAKVSSALQVASN